MMFYFLSDFSDPAPVVSSTNQTCFTLLDFVF